MTYRKRQGTHLHARNGLIMVLLAAVALTAAGCSSERDENDGQLFNTIVLPTDTLLNLACENVGVHPEKCVLGDPENPYAAVPITEFDINNPDAPFNKFNLADAIPAGPTGAKARFYLWATALARFGSGDNQYRTALALHELFDLNSDPLIQDQALKASRSVLDNFFGSVTVFTCFENEGCDPPIDIPFPLNEYVADHLYRTERTNFRRLVPGDPRNVLELMFTWGYAYQPANPPFYDDGVVTVISDP